MQKFLSSFHYRFSKCTLLFWVIFFGVFLFLFLWQGASALDPDFGWHIRMGQVILHSGIPKTDPFSYTMPSYPFVDHEWLSNIIISLLYPVLHYTGLAIITAFITLIAIGFQLTSVPTKLRKVVFIPLFLACVILLSFASVRTQMLTWLFFSILLWVLRDSGKFKQFGFFLPVIFLIWVNLHAGFAIGIVTLAIYAVVSSVINRRIDIRSFGIFLLCLGITFINPYGYRIWWEVWMQISDTSLHWEIQEWMPSLVQFNLPLWTFFSLSVFFVFRYWKKLGCFELVMYALLLLAGLSSIRHIPLWIIIALPLTITALGYFYHDVIVFPDGRERLKKAANVFLLIIGVMIIVQMFIDYQQTQFLSPTAYYPVEAVKYIAIHNPKGRIFTLYSWGGYVVWQLPEKKDFIDGRMPSFRWHAPNAYESSYAFKEYTGVMQGKTSFKYIVNRYHIDTILLHTQAPENPPGFWNTLRKRVRKYLGLDKQQGNDIEKQMAKADMKKVYQDDIAVVYERL